MCVHIPCLWKRKCKNPLLKCHEVSVWGRMGWSILFREVNYGCGGRFRLRRIVPLFEYKINTKESLYPFFKVMSLV